MSIIYTNSQITEFKRNDTGEKAKGLNIINTKEAEKEIRKIFHKHFGNAFEAGHFTNAELAQAVRLLLENSTEHYKGKGKNT